MAQHLIIGIDLGSTSAVACLSLEGRLLYIAHKKNSGISWIIKEASRFGTPSIIALDKALPNANAKRINAAFYSTIWVPASDIPMAEKREMAKRSGITNTHERDAYTAAVSAYRRYANKLNQADRIARKLMIEDLDRIKAKIINRYSIYEAVHGIKSNRRPA